MGYPTIHDVPHAPDVPECENQATVQSILGLNYTQYCDKNFILSDLESTIGKTFQECIDYCTRRAGCWGVVWDYRNYACWLKRYTPKPEDIIESPEHLRGALPFKNQMNKDPSSAASFEALACPYPNLSYQTISQGLRFKIFCGAGLDSENIYQDGGSIDDLFHTESMDDCLQICAQHHPLCGGIEFRADRDRGWANCWLKKSTFGGPQYATSSLQHAANAILDPLPAKADCNEEQRRTDEKDRTFRLSCKDLRNVAAVQTIQDPTHEMSISECLRRCAQAEPECIAVSYDEGLLAGFHNCYLFDRMPPPQERNDNHTFAYLVSGSAEFEEPSPLPPSKRELRWLWFIVLLVLLIMMGLYLLARKKKWKIWTIWHKRVKEM